MTNLAVLEPDLTRKSVLFNVYNTLAAAAAAIARKCATEAIAKGIASLARVPGRFERVDCQQPFTVVVDYAHTDDALRNLFFRSAYGGREGVPSSTV